MTRNVIDRLCADPQCDLTILLQDLNFYDPSIKKFAISVNHRLVGETRLERALLELRRRTVDRRLVTDLPLSRMIQRSTEHCDIYHCTDWYYYPSRKAGKNIITIYDLTTRLYPQYHEHTNIVKERRKAGQLGKFDEIIAISESTKHDIVAQYGIDERKITVIPLGADEVFENVRLIDKEDILTHYGIPLGRRYILSVSSIEPRKNIIGLLNAFQLFAEANPSYDDVLLILAGPMGWRNEGLADFLKDYPFKDRVIFTGYIATSDMPSLYHFAECFVYLSFYEGFGIPILEAMKSSCPVICSNTSSMPEVIGDCGQMVSPDRPKEASEAMANVLNDASLADLQRRKGFERSRRFTWDAFTKRLIEVYAM